MAFGLDGKVIKELNMDLALKRIQRDIQNDFIFAPHLNIIYHQAGEELYDQLISKFRSGRYSPRLPIGINVIKPNGFNRLGTILEPLDRLSYQLIVDLIAPVAEKEIDRTQVFSNRLTNDSQMFERSSLSYRDFRNRVQHLCESNSYSYVLRADVAAYFDRLYQHVLCNLLYSSGANKDAVPFLEKFLLQLSQNDSHGIVQGVFPSDFLGNFCLVDIDAQHTMHELPFARYVDDMYIFFSDSNKARVHKVKLANWLRRDGLTLNENKTKIYQTESLLEEETELDKLFAAAQQEVIEENVNIGYETNLFWDLESETELDEEEVILEANKRLFDLEASQETRQKIDRFCLPTFAVFELDYAIEYVVMNYAKDPSMAHTYFGYLSKMIRKEPRIVEDIENLFEDDDLIFDYQRKWLFATLLYSDKVSEKLLKHALIHLQDSSKNEGLRSLCAILLGKNGSAAQRRILKNYYSNETSEFVKSAILYSSQYFPPQEKDTCFKAWAGHNETNALIVTAIKKK